MSQGPFGPARAHNRSRVSWFSHGVSGDTYNPHAAVSLNFAIHFSYPHSPPPPLVPRPIAMGKHLNSSSHVLSRSDLSLFGSQPGSRCTSCAERARRICKRSSRSLNRSSPSYASPRSPAGLPTSSPKCACLMALPPFFLVCHTGFASS